MEERDTQIRRIAAMLMINKGMQRAVAIDMLCKMSREERVHLRLRLRAAIGGRRGASQV